MDLKEITLQVGRIARETGLYLSNERKSFRPEEIEQKRSHDYVSYVDREAEKMVVSKLNDLLPDAGFITEEGTVAISANTMLNWIIDPLDGTTNFIQDTAPYCVSIALRNDTDLLVGVIYEVCREECYYTWKDGPAYLNGNEIRVSNKPIEEAFIGLDLPYNAEEYKPVILNIFKKLYGKVSSLRINGSAAMGLCYVAAGRYDGWGEAFIKPWDYSAGALIARQAGARVTDYNGNEEITDTHHIIASNGIIHDELRQAFACNQEK